MLARIWKRLPLIALWGTLLFLAAFNVLLIRQNLQMRALLSKYEPKILQVGEKLQPFSAPGLHGELFNVNYDNESPKYVLLFFTPNCPYCRAQFVYWREVIKQVDGNRFRVLGVAAESEDKVKLEEYLHTVGCSIDTDLALPVAFISDSVRRSYKLSATPITLVVTNDGTVEKVWAGKWDSEDIAVANTILNLNIPTLPTNK